MIYDTLSHWTTYGKVEALEKAFQFVTHLKPGCAIGNYPIMGGEVFAKVMSLQTKPFAEAKPEAHRSFVDLQMVLSGEEFIDVYPTHTLTTSTPYDKESDFEFFQTPEEVAPLRLKLSPGKFVIFFPQDAHAPLITTGEGPEDIRKVVVKIDMDVLSGNHPDYS